MTSRTLKYSSQKGYDNVHIHWESSPIRAPRRARSAGRRRRWGRPQALTDLSRSSGVPGRPAAARMVASLSANRHAMSVPIGTFRLYRATMVLRMLRLRPGLFNNIVQACAKKLEGELTVVGERCLGVAPRLIARTTDDPRQLPSRETINA